MQVEAVLLGAQSALGDGAVVGVEHDAERPALVGWASGRAAGCGRGKQPGEERILLAHGFVADDGHLAVAGCGHEGDGSAALEEAEDALARVTHDVLDLLLRGRGVEHLALSLAVGGVDAVEKDGVKMWIQSEIAVCALDDGHGAGLANRQAALGVATAASPAFCLLYTSDAAD